MHQHPRPAPRSAAAANNPSTNPERTNNPRDQPLSRNRSSVDLASYTERAGGDAGNMASRNGNAASGSDERENQKLNQIIQNFHTKAALVICASRANLPQIQQKNGEIKQNRWFNLVIDDTDVLFDDLQEWRRPDLYDKRPPPLVIEFYLDTSHLTYNQALAVVDSNDKRWDVADALASSANSSPHPTKGGGRHCEVVLERWTVELGDTTGFSQSELNDPLPNVYKKGVVLFRSLYSFLRLLPAWRLHRRLGRQSGNHHSLRLKFRIRQGQGQGLAHGGSRQQDSLYAPLCPEEHHSEDIIAKHEFRPLACRAGGLTFSLHYRRACAFTIADVEALRSERFLGLDEDHPTIPLPAGRSLPGERSERPRERYSSTAAPTTTTTRERPRGLLGAYGSLGTFHGGEKRGSPVSELKQQQHIFDDEEQEDSNYMQRINKIREEEGATKRDSTNLFENPPFKAGSLASSPRPSPSPSTSNPNPESALARYGGSNPSNAGRSQGSPRPSQQQHQQLRPQAGPSEVAIASSGSTSPKPAPVRFSSSFAGRTRRWTSQSHRGGGSGGSSGRDSGTSDLRAEQPQDGAMPASSGSGKSDEGRSVRSDEEEIGSFLKDLNKAKEVTFHTPESPSGNVVNLAKYSSMRGDSAQLADEMSSSSLMQSTPPSRRLSNVPGLSTSISPNRTVTHAPHVRSRLSTHSIAEGDGVEEPEEEEEDEPFIFQQEF